MRTNVTVSDVDLFPHDRADTRRWRDGSAKREQTAQTEPLSKKAGGGKSAPTQSSQEWVAAPIWSSWLRRWVAGGLRRRASSWLPLLPRRGRVHPSFCSRKQRRACFTGGIACWAARRACWFHRWRWRPSVHVMLGERQFVQRRDTAVAIRDCACVTDLSLLAKKDEFSEKVPLGDEPDGSHDCHSDGAAVKMDDLRVCPQSAPTCTPPSQSRDGPVLVRDVPLCWFAKSGRNGPEHSGPDPVILPASITVNIFGTKDSQQTTRGETTKAKTTRVWC